MPRLEEITIENYRSIGSDPITIKFQKNTPVTLIGENNAGKSNIIRAIEFMFGEFHPKYQKLEEYDFHQRDVSRTIVIEAKVSEMKTPIGRPVEECVGFKYRKEQGNEAEYYGITSSGELNSYVSNNLRKELLCVVVSSEQNLSYQLSYSSKYTLLSKVTKAFHDKLVSDHDKVRRLKKLFEETKAIFHEVEEFKKFSNDMSTIADEMMSNMTHGLKFDFSSYDPSNYFKNLQVMPYEGSDTRAFEELGTGQQQILALSFAKAYSDNFMGENMILILDEPETHLHPLAQKWLAKHMHEFAKDGLQLIITTHSPYFIDLEYLPGIYMVSKPHQTLVQNINAREFTKYCNETGAPNASDSTILGFYSAHSRPGILSGLFANKVILVEGATEELALPILLEGVGFDVLAEGVAVIGVGGKGNLAKWWRLFTALDVPTYVCFDNDSKNDKEGNKRKDALKAIGIEIESIHEVLKSTDWNINEKFCVFGLDYEASMKKTFSEYAKIEKEKVKILGSSKPIVARAVAKRLKSNSLPWEWKEIKEIVSYIKILQ